MASIESSKQITRLVLEDEDCYTSLKRDLNPEVIEKLWLGKYICDEEWEEIAVIQIPSQRNKKFIDILKTK